MALLVETPVFGPDTNQYAGQGQPAVTLAQIADICRLCEDVGFDGITTAEAGHDAFLPLMIAAAHTERMKLGTNIAIGQELHISERTVRFHLRNIYDKIGAQTRSEAAVWAVHQGLE